MLKKIIFIIIASYSTAVTAYNYQHSQTKVLKLIEAVDKKAKTKSEALLEINEFDIEVLLKPSVIEGESATVAFIGKPACTGAVSGVVCFEAHKLEEYRDKFGTVIWVTNHINNDDLCYLKYADAICAFKEDPSSHAIIVTRVNNVPCITLIDGAQLHANRIEFTSGTIQEGAIITIDAFNGKVYASAQKVTSPDSKKLINTILSWSDENSKLSIHANADTAIEANAGLQFGAKGVDPRSEHMFFHPHSLKVFRKVILGRENVDKSLEELKEIQRKDILQLMKTMGALPIKIRLLDPPLHEFLPEDSKQLKILATELNISTAELKKTIDTLQEDNPMMGHRGVRLLLTFPEILENQVLAIFEAAYDESLKDVAVNPVIIIPMVVHESEVIAIKKVISKVQKTLEQKYGRSISYKVGVMIETPRACIIADKIAPHVSYFSFGTNDLTGLTFAFSRGDVYKKFLKHYLDKSLLNNDPFSHLDTAVIRLMEMSVKKGRIANKNLRVGICGEQASEKNGVFACHLLGLNSISCSPHRIPVVRLFAAQAAILHPSRKG